MNNEELFADLFAYRFVLIDIYSENGDEINETEIIKKLKYKLIEMGKNSLEINDILYEFYNYYGIPITLEEIQNTRILLLLFSDLLNREIDIRNITETPNTQNNNNINIISTFIRSYLNNENEELYENEQEEKMTEEEINELEIIDIKEELDDTCSICLDKIEINSKIYKISCNHKYHINCIKPHLINYNRRCPICRKDINGN